MEKDLLPMGRTFASCGSLEAVEGVGLVILEVDHAETSTHLMELIHELPK